MRTPAIPMTPTAAAAPAIRAAPGARRRRPRSARRSEGDPDGAGGDPGGPDDDRDGPGGYPDGSGAPDGSGDDPDDGFDDRSVRLDTTLGGAGVLYGDLAPDCASLVKTVLEALSAPAGAQDTRGKAQRWHDGLADAMRRLLAAGLLPGRAGADTKAVVHVALAELRVMPGGSGLEAAWVARAQQDWAGHRAAAAIAGGDGGAWLNGDAARGAACDALTVPVVTGQVNPAVLDRLVGLCLELAGHRRGRCQPAGPEPGTGAVPEPGTPDGLTGHARAMLQRAVIGAAIDLVSGPGGLASVLRTGLLGARLAGPSLPLDVGYAETVPAGIRHAVLQRARGHCEWPGGCRQPAAACHIHHITRKADGGKTSVKNCALLCQLPSPRRRAPVGLDADPQPRRHHHRLQPRRHQVLHSHGPPPRPG